MFRRAVPWLAALAAALHAANFAGYGPCDDDFIVYRYARNLVEGLGLVFNAGERVEGFTSPGWTLAVAAALGVGIPPDLFAVVVSILSAAAAAFFVARVWLRRHPRDTFAAPAWLVAASPVIGWHAVTGLGTIPLAALLALWIDSWDRALRRDRPALGAALTLGLATFVRAESVLFAVPFLFVERKRGQWLAALPCLAPLVLWQIFRVAYYDRWLPITWSVKKLGLGADLRLGFEYFAVSTWSTGLAFALALGLVCLTRDRERASAALRACVGGLLAHVAFVVYVGGDFFPLARFFAPVLPLALLVACEGFVRFVTWPRAYAAGALALAVAAQQWPQWKRPELLDTHLDSEPRWAAMGREVAARVPPSTRVALAPIGAFGFESGLYVVDMLGLTNTAIAAAEPDPTITIKGHQRYDADWVLAQSPEMIILGNGWLHPGPDGVPILIASAWEGTLVAHPRFLAEYEPLEIDVASPDPRIGYPLLFYWRRGVAWPAGARAP